MKVIYIRVHEDIHEVLRLLAVREETTIQALGKSAISQFLDMAYQQGKIPDDEANGTQQERTVHNKAANPADQLSLGEIEKLPVLFTVRNNWRNRNVVCHRHPHRVGGIISVGYSFDGATVTVGYETENDWARELDELPWRQSFVYN